MRIVLSLVFCNHFLELLGVEVDIEELPESSLFRFCILYCLLFSDNSIHDFGRILPETQNITISLFKEYKLTVATSVRRPGDGGCRVLPEVVEALELGRGGLRLARGEGGPVSRERRLGRRMKITSWRKPATRRRGVDIRFCV